MAAGFLGGVSDSLRAIAALIAVLVLPAVVLDRVAGARAPGTGPFLRPLLSFLAWLSLIALWSGLFALARAPFHVYAAATTWLLLILYVGAAVFPLVRPRAGTALPRVAPLATGIALACVLFAALIPSRFGVNDDSLDHIGYIRHMMTEDAVRPAGVLVLPADAQGAAPGDPRKGALHPVIAFTSALSATEPLTVWRWLRVLMFPVAVFALCAFNAAFLPSFAAAVAAGVLILLSFHGNLFRFAGSSAHGESLAALWAWMLTALVLCSARRDVRRPLWLVLAAGGVLVHMGIAAHVLVLAATLVCFGAAWGIERAERLRLALTLLAGVAIGAALRAYDLGGSANLIHAHTQGVLFVASKWFVVSPMEILRLQGMLFLGGLVLIPVLALALRRRADARAITAAAVIPFVLALVPWVATPLFARGSYMVFRTLLNVPVYAATVACALWLVQGVRRRRWSAWLFGVPAALVWLVIFARPVARSLAREVSAQSHARTQVGVPVAPALRDAVMQLPSNAVLLSDPATSYALSAVTSARFVAVEGQHATPRDPFAIDRLRAVRDVLSPYVMPNEAANACRRFHVAYVIVNPNVPPDASRFMAGWSRAQYADTIARMRAMSQSFALIDTVGGARIYRFETGAPVNWSWSSQDQPVRVGSPSLTPCSVNAPGDEFATHGLSVSPAHAMPGDTVQVTMGYRRDAASRFGLPLLMHVRFDHETLGRTREYPGEKIVRRLSDGRSGVRTRFRADFIPGHGVYDFDLWPVGFDLCETFPVVIPASAKPGRYDVRVALAYDTVVPNFHLRDILYNRDHYSGAVCGSLTVVGKLTGAQP